MSFPSSPKGCAAYRGDYESYRKQRAEEAEILENKAKNLELERKREHGAPVHQPLPRPGQQGGKAVQSRSQGAGRRWRDVETLPAAARSCVFTSPSRGAHRQRGRARSTTWARATAMHEVLLRRGRSTSWFRAGTEGRHHRCQRRRQDHPVARSLPVSSRRRVAARSRSATTIEVGYYAQHHADTCCTRESTVFEEVQRRRQGGVSARPAFAPFSAPFSSGGDDVDKPISVLSGGEKARVALAQTARRTRAQLLLDGRADQPLGSWSPE